MLFEDLPGRYKYQNCPWSRGLEFESRSHLGPILQLDHLERHQPGTGRPQPMPLPTLSPWLGWLEMGQYKPLI
jgi:hypothetical protein